MSAEKIINNEIKEGIKVEIKQELRDDNLNNFKEISSDFIIGIWDSLQIFSIFNLIHEKPKILNNIKNCLILNGLLFIGSMIFYIYLINPFIEFIIDKISFLGYFLLIGKYFYYFFWLIPVYLLCNIITSFWIDEIYYESLEVIEGSRGSVEGQDLVTNISNQVERLLIVICFIIFIAMINILNFIPGMFILKYMTLSILNSLYVFEYILLQKYIRNYKSIMNFIENKFFYFLGFGMLLTIMINIIDSVTVNSSIFLMAFPFFLITSIKVNNKRFQHFREIKQTNFIFFCVIARLYQFGWTILNRLFYIFKNSKSKQ